MAERLFLALWLPDPVAHHLHSRIAGVQRDSPAWLRWQPRSRWHITLCFLGDRGEGERDRIESVAAGAAAAAAADEVRLAGSGRFGAVWWVGVQHSGWLDRVARSLNRGLVPHDQRRRFHGHVTIARARGRGMRPPGGAVLSGYEGPWWVPEEMVLVRSELGPHPRYRTVAAWPLPAAGG